MKRIFAIFLCALMICTILIVPVSASAADDYVTLEAGTYTFNDYMDFSYLDDIYLVETANNARYLHIPLNFTVTSESKVHEVYNIIIYCDTDIYVTLEAHNAGTLDDVYYDNVWHGTGVNVFTIIDNQSVHTAVYDFITGNSKYEALQYCDGTICSVTDFNNDDVCDDCELPFTYSLLENTYNYNGYRLANIPTSNVSTNPYYLIFENNGTYEFHMFSTPVYVDSSGTVKASEAGNRYIYHHVDSAWELQYDGAVTYTKDDIVVNGANQVVWINYDLYDNYGSLLISGDTNFPLPLPLTILLVVKGAIPMFNSRVGGNLMILTLCGVGLLTLLMALYLLYRLLRTYLPR